MGPGRTGITKEFATALTQWIGRPGHSVAELIRLAGVSRRTIQRCVAGNRLDAGTHARIAAAIGYGTTDPPAGVAPGGRQEIHVTLQPGARLTIVIDAAGVTVTGSPES